MADVDITINYPVIIAPAKFKTRYRLVGGVYSSNVDRDNTQFTLSGLADGTYELEIIYVTATGVECEAVIKRFVVVTDYDCSPIGFSAQIVDGGNSIYYLEINFTAPANLSPVAADPPCGWEIEYTQGSSGTVTIPYTTLPTSNQIRIVVANQSTVLRIYALMCNGKEKQCYVADVAAITPPPCVPASGVTFAMREVFNAGLGKCDYYVDVTFTQSSPVTNPIRLIYAQQGGLVSDQFNGLITVGTGGAPQTFTRKLNPVMFNLQECTTYDFALVDICGNSTNQRIDFCRTICFDKIP